MRYLKKFENVVYTYDKVMDEIEYIKHIIEDESFNEYGRLRITTRGGCYRGFNFVRILLTSEFWMINGEFPVDVVRFTNQAGMSSGNYTEIFKLDFVQEFEDRLNEIAENYGMKMNRNYFSTMWDLEDK